MAGYTRQSAADIVTSAIVQASHLNAEYDAMSAAMHQDTGHTHGGSSGEGAPILSVGPVQDFVATATELKAKTHNTYALGTSAVRYTTGWFQGNVHTAGAFLAGHTSVITVGDSGAETTTTPKAQIVGAEATSGLSVLTYNLTPTYGATLTLGTSKTNTVGTNAATSNGFPLGIVRFEGADGTSFVEGGSIRATVDGTVGTSVVPGKLEFYTTSTSGSSAQRMSIDNSGSVKIGIGATTSAAALEVVSTSRGVLFPRLTTAQRDVIASPVNGLMIYNSTLNKFQGYAGGSWVDFH